VDFSTLTTTNRTITIQQQQY